MAIDDDGGEPAGAMQPALEPATGPAAPAAPPALEPGQRRPLLSVRGLADSATLVLLSGTAVGLPAGYLGGLFWGLELFVHFRLQYLGAALASSILALACGRRRVALVAGLLAAGIAASLVPAWLGAPEAPDPSAPRLTLVFSNVNSSNREHERLLSLVRREQPELVAIAEVDQAWAAALEQGLPEWPHRVVVPRQDNFGIALFSKLPLETHELLDLGVQGVPTIEAIVELGGERLTLLVTHPVPPISEDNHAAGTDGLAELGDVAREVGPLVVVVGDLNSTPWAPQFDALLASGLVDSRAGRGLQASWPTAMPLLMLPLDHLLHGKRLVTVRRELCEPIGSDHLPLVVELALLPP